ncbi:AsmA family protein [Rhodobacteraceae bacterium WD3A24]|nr:AsmA family protein [Rhodobacteraceae bacterium WD3A24]
MPSFRPDISGQAMERENVMGRIARWVFRLLGVVVVLALLAVAALPLIPAERLASLAAERFESATGRALSFDGEVRASVFPVLGVRTGPVRLANADWSEAGPLFAAEGLDIGLDPLALIGGDIAIRAVTARAPDIRLERAADGRANWAFGAAPQPEAGDATQPESGARAVSIGLAEISDGRVQYVDHGAGTRLDLAALDLSLTLPDYTGPAEIDLSAQIDGRDVAVSGRVARFAALLEGEVTPLEATLATGGGEIAFDGRAGTAPAAAEGRLRADLDDLPALMALAGQPAPALPAGIGETIALETRLTLAGAGSLHLRETALTLDRNRLNGAADLTFDGARPHLTARFSGGALDLSALAGAQDAGAGGTGNGGNGWPSAPIDVSALAVLDAVVELDAESIDLGAARLGATRLRLVNERARAVLGLREVRLYDGLLTGEVVLNGRGGVSVGGDLRAEDVALQPLLAALAGQERLAGTGSARIDFLGAGPSVAAIMNSLSGGGSLDFGAGEIIGLDLAGMLRNLDPSYIGDGNRTIYNSITAQFDITDGVLRNDDLVLDGPLVSVEGAGEVALGAREVDYTVTPVALRDAAGEGGLRLPLRISGPWAAPGVSLDTQGAVSERLDAGREALEDRARQAVESAVGDRLGTNAEDGETGEDAAQPDLESEITEGLETLFGR